MAVFSREFLSEGSCQEGDDTVQYISKSNVYKARRASTARLKSYFGAHARAASFTL